MSPDRLVVNCNPTAKSLPFRVGARRGFFADFGIDFALVSTENSREQRSGLAAGAFQVVHVAIDNAIAMRDVDGVDVVVVMGGDPGMNDLITQPTVGKLTDMKGGKLVVDAPDTAFAFQAYRMFADVGLVRGVDYQVVKVGRGAHRIKAMLEDRSNTAAVLNIPYSLEAQRAGLKSFGDTTDYIGPYQANAAFALRPWAEANRDLLTRYIAAYVECLRWVMAPENAADGAAILVEDLNVERDVAAECVRRLTSPRTGFEPNAEIDDVALANTLALRATFGDQASLGRPSDYIDMSFHRAAMALPRPRGKT
jgi:ABC-type nitrate/sulfonate/bicarbonate transport system substrate-binding protein